MQRDRSEVGTVFWVSAAFSLAFILWGVIAPESFAAVTQVFFDWIVANLGWFYLLAGNFFFAFVIILALSRYGRLRLGKEGERPEFRRFAWFAMLFQAGMGPALIFWGVAEPLMHYKDPPFGLARPGTTDAAQVAMQYSYFHWAFLHHGHHVRCLLHAPLQRGPRRGQDLDVAERAREAPAVRRTPGRPAPGQAFTAQDPTPDPNRQPRIREPGMEGQ